MRLVFALIFTVLISNFTWAQAPLSPIVTFQETAGNPLHEYVRTYRHTDVPKEFTGSFYNEEEFVPGVVEVEGQDQKINVFLRYNAIEDDIELKLKKNEETVYVLPKYENIIYKTKDYSYRYGVRKNEEGKQRPGYIVYYYNGEELVFISHPMAHMQREVKPKSGYDRYKPAHYSVKHFYFLQEPDGNLTEVELREKDFRKQLSNSPQMKDYFSEHKIRTVEDVVEMLKFYEEQKKSS